VRGPAAQDDAAVQATSFTKSGGIYHTGLEPKEPLPLITGLAPPASLPPRLPRT
jgi:hypothetical protein